MKWVFIKNPSAASAILSSINKIYKDSASYLGLAVDDEGNALEPQQWVSGDTIEEAMAAADNYGKEGK